MKLDYEQKPKRFNVWLLAWSAAASLSIMAIITNALADLFKGFFALLLVVSFGMIRRLRN